MNVLQAMDKLKEIDAKIAALNIATGKLEVTTYNSEIKILKELHEELEIEYKRLRDRLEKTQLATVR